MDAKLLATMALQLLPGLGPARYWRLLEHFADPEAILTQPACALSALLSAEACADLADYQKLKSASKLGQKLSKSLDWLTQQTDITLLTPEHSDYPNLLRHIPRPPPLLYARGNYRCLNLPQIAVVGSRNPTQGGHDNAFQFSRYLATHGFTITSGLALGVDGSAHTGALAAQGTTIAVLGTGIDKIYPLQHRALAQQILVEGGLLLSEFPVGTAPHASHFPQRNRLISGLSYGTLVVEAAVRSGSLITARQALQQDREVFAIPGSIHNPLARGCHSLIKDGAHLVETAEDIVAELGSLLKHSQTLLPEADSGATLAPELTSEEQTLLAAVGFDPTPFDLVVERSAIPVEQVSTGLMALELRGILISSPHGYIRRDFA